MKRIIFYVNQKGGCGKSFASCAHADILRTSGAKPVLVDTDGEVGHLARMFGERDAAGNLLAHQSDAGVQRFSFHADERSRVEFASILDRGSELILADLPAASITLLRGMEQSYGIFGLAHEQGYAVTIVVVITPDAASMGSVRGAADLDPNADLVVVKNAAFGDPTRDFVVWDGSIPDGISPAKGKTLLAERGGIEITLPMLDRGTVALIGACKVPFSVAARIEPKPGDSVPLKAIGRRSQVATWLRDVDAAYRQAGAVMGLEPFAKREVKRTLGEVEA